MTCRQARRAPLRRLNPDRTPSGPEATVFESGEGPGVLGCFRFAMRANPSRTPPHLNHGGFGAGGERNDPTATKPPTLVKRGRRGARSFTTALDLACGPCRDAVWRALGTFTCSQRDEILAVNRRRSDVASQAEIGRLKVGSFAPLRPDGDCRRPSANQPGVFPFRGMTLQSAETAKRAENASPSYWRFGPRRQRFSRTSGQRPGRFARATLTPSNVRAYANAAR